MSEIDSGGIFVSYRRQDTRHVAGRLFDRLAERFGRSHVFMDVISIEPGFDFVGAIDEAVSGCDVLLALIGQSWLGAVDEHGRRRLDNPDDLVLLEVKAALDQGVRVIPVLVDGTSAPRQDELPEAIASLTRRNWVRLDHETFGSDVGVLMDVLDRIIRPDSGRSAAGPSVVVGQDDAEPGGQADDSQQSYQVGQTYADYQADPHQARDRVLQAVRLLEDGGGTGREGGNLFPGLKPSAEETNLLTSWWARGGRRRRASLIIIGLVVALVLGIGVLLTVTRDATPTVTSTIQVGNAPVGVAVSPDGRRAYITNGGSGTVSVIDTDAGTVTDIISVGVGPFGAAVSSDGRRAYITNFDFGTVSVIDTATDTVTDTIRVGDHPQRVAVSPEGRRAYITKNSNIVSVIDTSTDTVTATILVGDYPVGVAVSPDGRRAYTTNYNSDTVSVIDTGAGTATATISVGDRPIGVAVSPDGNRAYITNERSNTVSVIDTATNTVTATIRVGATPWGVAVSPDGSRAYITEFDSGTMSVIDTGGGTVTTTIAVGLGPRGVAVSPDGRRTYVVNDRSGTVSVIDTG